MAVDKGKDSVAPVKTKVVQVANIAPQATRDQMQTLFGYLGKVEDLRLYPIARDVSIPVQSRICYVKFFDEKCVGISQHLTNTVFIDRALIVTPYNSGEMPDEQRALEIAAQQQNTSGESKLPAHVVNQIEGVPPNQVITTLDPILAHHGLPPYPPLPITFEARKIEEVRRTLVAINIEETVSAQELVDFFQKAGTVNYIRFCSREDDSQKYALIEFSDQASILDALKLNGATLKGKTLQMYHSTQCIQKPEAKSNETAQREIEEAMSRVKEAQNMISAAIDPVIGILSKDKKKSSSPGRRHRSRSRSRGRRRRSRSHSRHSRSRRRSRSRQRSHRGRKSRSRSRDRKRSRSCGSKRRSRDRKRSRSRRRSVSRDRKRSSRSKRRSRSRSRRHSPKRYDDKKRDRKGGNERKRSRSKDKSKSSSRSPAAKSKSRSGSRSISRRRSQSPKKKTSRSQSQKLSRSPSQKTSRSPSRKTSRSPVRKALRSPGRKTSRSPTWKSQSPGRKSSVSPGKKASQSVSKSRSASRSPATRKRERSPTWGGSVSPKSPPHKARSRSP